MSCYSFVLTLAVMGTHQGLADTSLRAADTVHYPAAGHHHIATLPVEDIVFLPADMNSGRRYMNRGLANMKLAEVSLCPV